MKNNNRKNELVNISMEKQSNELEYEILCSVKIPGDKTSLDKLNKRIELIKQLMLKKGNINNLLLDDIIICREDTEGNKYYEYFVFTNNDLSRDKVEVAAIQNIGLLTMGLGNVVAEFDEYNVIVKDLDFMERGEIDLGLPRLNDKRYPTVDIKDEKENIKKEKERREKERAEEKKRQEKEALIALKEKKKREKEEALATKKENENSEKKKREKRNRDELIKRILSYDKETDKKERRKKGFEIDMSR